MRQRTGHTLRSGAQQGQPRARGMQPHALWGPP
eukprot:CAMPEP_0179104850 /NCGR_PEP_ID=MMETSP0796-20121207/48663_1 /TAXON_ID=73915 /ORGANISM="Pyrodinium bahamense, Strain pbaha01" /LENGTH=32 /DNA_ID= /DNA_START= /DNA_END= /DNA_ORIENTATION=